MLNDNTDLKKIRIIYVHPKTAKWTLSSDNIVLNFLIDVQCLLMLQYVKCIKRGKVYCRGYGHMRALLSHEQFTQWYGQTLSSSGHVCAGQMQLFLLLVHFWKVFRLTLHHHLLICTSANSVDKKRIQLSTWWNNWLLTRSGDGYVWFAVFF